MVTARRRCLNCSLLLAPFMRRHNIGEIPESITFTLRAWITPTPVSNGDILCDPCYILLQNADESQELVLPAVGHEMVCYGCGISILRSRTHNVPLNSPQRTLIMEWVPPHQMNRLKKVCRACWMAATRTIQRQQLHDSERLENPAVPEILPQEEMEIEDNIPAPPPLPEIREMPQPARPAISKINSNIYV